MQKHVFEFYKVLKNEDVPPYVHADKDGGFMVVADGLGGSGSYKHSLLGWRSDRIAEDLVRILLGRPVDVARKPAESVEPPESTTDATATNTENMAALDADRIADAVVDAIQDTVGDATLADANAGDEDKPIDQIYDEMVIQDQYQDRLTWGEGFGETTWEREQREKQAESVTEVPQMEDARQEEIQSEPVEVLPAHFFDWAKRLIGELSEGEPHTSAMWGSRVLAIRAVEYLYTHPNLDLSDEAVRADMVRHIDQGLDEVKDAFGLSLDGRSNMALLPSTFVALRYAFSDGAVSVEVIWAGDSRAYALIDGEGLKQLTEDDEDDSGAINNLFRASPRTRPTTLHYAKYRLPAKSLLFACSDGFFDLYDADVENIGVESALLSCMQRAASYEAFRQAWYEYFLPSAHDDCSVACGVFGFESYEDMRQGFAERAERLGRLIEDYYQNKKLIPFVLGQDEPPEQYVIDRANARIQEISALVLEEVLNNPDTSDPTVTEEVRAFVAELDRRAQDAMAQEKSEREARIALDILRELREEPTCVRQIVAIDSSVTSTPLAAQLRVLTKAVEEEARVVDYWRTAKDNAARMEEKMRAAEQSCNDILHGIETVIQNNERTIREIDEWLRQGNSLMKERTKTNKDAESREHFKRVQKDFQRWSRELENTGREYARVVEFWKQRREPDAFTCNLQSEKLETFKQYVREYDRKEQSYKTSMEAVSRAQTAVEDVRKKTQEMRATFSEDVIRAAVADYEHYLTPRACELYGLPVDLTPQALSREEARALFVVYLQSGQDDAYRKLIDAFVCSTVPSVVEKYFNKPKLTVLREYKRADPDKIREMLAKILQITLVQDDLSSIQA